MMSSEPEMSSPRERSRHGLSRERVLQTAIEFADTHGIEALSMRKLGQQLGVEAMSLYNHIASKDALLDGMVEVVVREINIPSSGTEWKRAMHERALSAHVTLLRHRWACSLFMSRINVGPEMLRYVNATIGILREAGFSVAMADRAWTTIDSYIYGFTLHKLNFPFAQNEYRDAAATYLPTIPRAKYPHLAEMAESIMTGAHDGTLDFSFGLNLLLDGLARCDPEQT